MHIYKLLENKKISPTTRLIRLQNDEQGRPFGFQPGQYAAISFRHNGKPTPARCFSITSSPTDQEVLEFTMRVHGNFTKAVSDIKVGDQVKVFGPFGGFMLNTNKDKNVIMLAGGIGITPFISMIRYVTRLKTDNKIYMLYSCRTQDDIPFQKDLIEYSKENPNFKVVFVIGDKNISQLPSGMAVAGNINPELIERVTQGVYQGRRFFVCGPPPFMKAITGSLIAKQVDKKNIMTESFSQASHPQSGILKSWPANIYALGALGVVMGSATVMVNDLLNNYHTTSSQNVSAPFSITNSRQQQIDDIVNSIPITPTIIASSTQGQSTAPGSKTNTPTPSGGGTTPTPTGGGTTPAPTGGRTTPTPTGGGTTPSPSPTPTPTPTPTPPPNHTTASSDIRLKEQVRYLATILNDLKVYSFKYIGNNKTYVGVMAQDLLGIYPEAVVTGNNGFYEVKYGLLGIKMISLSEWKNNPSSIFLNYDEVI